MNTVTRIQEALHDLGAELAHAEALISDQAERIEALETEVARLQQALVAGQYAA